MYDVILCLRYKSLFNLSLLLGLLLTNLLFIVFSLLCFFFSFLSIPGAFSWSIAIVHLGVQISSLNSSYTLCRSKEIICLVIDIDFVISLIFVVSPLGTTPIIMSM